MTDVNIVKQLRDATGAGFADCKNALQACKDNIEDAKVYLRKQGVIDANSRAHKVAQEGTIGVYQHNDRICATVVVMCESDFTSRTSDFKDFAHDVAMHIAASNPRWVSRQDVPKDVVDRETDIISNSVKDKPAAVQSKIIAGKLNKFYKETCLLEQPFVKDPKITIQDLLGVLVGKYKENILIKAFSRLEV